MEKHTVHAQAFVNRRSVTILDFFRIVVGDLNDILSGAPVLDHNPLHISCVILTRVVPLLPWIRTDPDGNFWMYRRLM